MPLTSSKNEIVLLSEAERQEVGGFLSWSISHYDDEELLQQIADGADVNATDILALNKELLSPPLIRAIDCNNFSAFKILLSKGARVNITTHNGVPALNRLLASGGNFNMLQEMLLQGADPNSYYSRSALQGAVTCLPSFAIIKYATNWSIAGIGQQLLDWHEQQGAFATTDPEKGVPFSELKETIRCTYFGQLEAISLLLAKGAHPWISDDYNVTLLDILESPLKYKKSFLQVRNERVKFLESTNNDIMSFEVTLSNRNDSAPPIKIIVDYDLREIKARIETYIKRNPNYQGLNIKTLSEGLNGKISDAVQEKINEQRPHEKAIKELQKDPIKERYFDILSRKLKIMLQAYEGLSSGMFVRDEQTKAEIGAFILSKIGDHAPHPFNVAFTAVSTVINIASAYIEKKRYQHIAKLLPADMTIQEFSREISCKLTQKFSKRFGELGGDLSLLQKQDIKALAVRSFVVAIHAVYEVDNLGIDLNLPANERSELLREKIIEKVLNSKHLNELIEKKVKLTLPQAALEAAEIGQELKTSKNGADQPSKLSKFKNFFKPKKSPILEKKNAKEEKSPELQSSKREKIPPIVEGPFSPSVSNSPYPYHNIYNGGNPAPQSPMTFAYPNYMQQTPGAPVNFHPSMPSVPPYPAQMLPFQNPHYPPSNFPNGNGPMIFGYANTGVPIYHPPFVPVEGNSTYISSEKRGITN